MIISLCVKRFWPQEKNFLNPGLDQILYYKFLNSFLCFSNWTTIFWLFFDAFLHSLPQACELHYDRDCVCLIRLRILMTSMQHQRNASWRHYLTGNGIEGDGEWGREGRIREGKEKRKYLDIQQLTDSLTHSLSHSFSKHLWNVCYKPGIVFTSKTPSSA